MLSTEVKLYDTSDMFGVLSAFPDQVEEAFTIGSDIQLPDYLKNIDKVIVCGLGGSAIGGDLLRSYLWYEIKIPIYINRNYRLPAFADENTLAIISSYSGDTEESLSCYDEAEHKGCKLVGLSSGGKLSIIAESNSNLLISVPKGYQPRCALGFSFFPLLVLMNKLGFVNDKSDEIGKVRRILQTKVESYTMLDEAKNNASKIAKLLKNKIPVIYSSSDILDVVNLRWRTQIEENAKMVAYGNYLPEMNHNEIVGWQENPEILRNIAVISLTDAEDHPRNRKRNEITINLISNLAGLVMELDGDGDSRLERMFDLIYLGDWVSYYLAVMNKIDPTPVEKIAFLKNKLAEN
jgi:glucose/mannose-6-phosphate isomerase